MDAESHDMVSMVKQLIEEVKAELAERDAEVRVAFVTSAASFLD